MIPPGPLATALEPPGVGLDQAERRLVDALRHCARPLLIAHVGPDADALGSALALGLALDEFGIDAAVSFGESRFEIPRSLEWLPGIDLVVTPDQVADRLGGAPDLAIALDSSSADRLGVLYPAFAAAPLRAVVDHHTSYTGYGDIAVVDPAVPATAVLVLGLVDHLGVPLSADIATCLYAGLVTDTGSFRFPATQPATHLVAARLLAAGVRPDLVARRVFDDTPLAALRMLAGALDRAQLHPDAAGGLGLVATTVARADREAHGVPFDAAERVIEALRGTEEAEVAAVLKQDDEGAWRVSLRSRGQVDVGTVAVRLGGGGHRFAAGFTARTGPDQTLAELRAHLDPPGDGPTTPVRSLRTPGA